MLGLGYAAGSQFSRIYSHGHIIVGRIHCSSTVSFFVNISQTKIDRRIYV